MPKLNKNCQEDVGPNGHHDMNPSLQDEDGAATYWSVTCAYCESVKDATACHQVQKFKDLTVLLSIYI